MVKHSLRPSPADLDTVFSALAHSARRDTLDALAAGASSVSELAAPHDMSLAGFMKHVRVLEAAGLIACAKQGRTVTCSLAGQPLRSAGEWLASRERMWETRLDALGRHLYHRQEVTVRRKGSER